MSVKPANHSPAQDTYDPAFFAALAAIEDRHFWFRARNEIIAAQVKLLTAELSPGYKVLEVGCGTGYVLRMLEKVCGSSRVTGMDLFEEGLKHARLRTACRLVQGDIHQPPFDERFDIVGLFDVLEHLPDDVQVLTDLGKLLAPGAAILLTVPAHPSLWSYFDETAHHCRRYEQKELEAKLAATGYQIEFMTQFMACTFPLVWLGRRLAALKERWFRGGALDMNSAHELTAKELRITPVVNEILTFCLMQEARIVARRRHLPIGSSLLVVARKISS